MSAPTPEKLAELRRLLDAATPGPWRDEMMQGQGLTLTAIIAGKPNPDDLRVIGSMLAHNDARAIVAAVNALPALLDAAAERDALAAKVERVRALHRPAYNDAARSPLCPDCAGKAGVHPCGCWADTDYEPVCAVCNQGHKGMSVPWPCPTSRAIDEAESWAPTP